LAKRWTITWAGQTLLERCRDARQLIPLLRDQFGIDAPAKERIDAAI